MIQVRCAACVEVIGYVTSQGEADDLAESHWPQNCAARDLDPATRRTNIMFCNLMAGIFDEQHRRLP